MARGATFGIYKTFIAGEIFYHTDANGMQTQIVNNLDPSGVGSYFTSNAEFHTTSDPYASVTPVIPTSLLVWMQQVHYMFLQTAQARGLNPTNWEEDITGLHGTTGGTGSAYTLTVTPPLNALLDGLPFLVDFHATNTSTTPTLAISGLTAKTLVKVDGSALGVSDIPANAKLWVVYDGTNYQVLLPFLTTDITTNVTAADTTLAASDCYGGKTYTNWNSATVNNFNLPAAAANLKIRLRVTTGTAGSVGIKWTCNGAETCWIGGTTKANLTSYVAGSEWELLCEQSGASAYRWTAKLKGVQPSFRAYLSGTQIPSDGADTLVAFDTESAVDTDNNNEYTNTAGNYKHIATIPGKWTYHFAISCGTTINTDAYIYLFKNSSAFVTRLFSTNTGGNMQCPFDVSIQTLVDGDDVFQVYVNLSGAARTVLGTNATFSIFEAHRESD